MDSLHHGGLFHDGCKSIKELVKDLEAQDKGDEGNARVYEMDTPSGKARMLSYRLFDGIELMFQEVSMKEVSHRAKPLPGLFEIHYCLEGRVECNFHNGRVLYMDESDISVGWKVSDGFLHSTYFPSSHFKGVNLAIYVPKAQAVLNEFVGHDRINLEEVCNRFCNGTDFGMITRKDQRLSDLFHSLYHIPEEVHTAFCRLKCMEILVLLSTMEKEQPEESQYFEKSQVDKVKQLHDELVANLDQKFTIDELAEKYHIAPTALKKCFKGIYGSSIYQYMKQFRMKAAARELVQGEETILNIANRYGYENGSKFSEAFRAVMGEKPSEYRKKNKMSEWSVL